jgi:nitrate reductase delta subunit
VSLFDRSRSLSLHIFEHVHGESRDRGQALVDLRQLYERGGFTLAANELPDYLPAFLEFVAQRPLDEAKALLADTTHILEAIGGRLVRRGSAYGAVFRALIALSGGKSAPLASDEAEAEQDDDPAALDARWEEAPAFGLDAAGCAGTKTGDVSVIRFHRGAAR